jgi:TRAP-type C4-dicarboxylate transport system substrate-binding protein
MRLGKLVLSTAFASIVAAAPAAAAEYEWRFFTYVAPTDFHAKMNKAFADDISKSSGGRLNIVHYGAGELPYKAGDVIKAVATNQIQMGQVGAGLAAGDAPEIDVFSLPFLCTSYDGFAAATKAMGNVPDDVLSRKFGVRVIMNWPIPGQNIWTTAKVDNIAGLAG